MRLLDSIKGRILAFALVATLIPALSTGWLSYRQNRRALSEKTAEELRAAGTQAARDVNLWRKEHLYDVRVFASSYEVTENLDALRGRAANPRALARLNEYLTSVQERFPHYRRLGVVGQAGRLVAMTGTPDADTAALASPAMLEELRTGDAVLGAPRQAGPDDAIMTIAVPVTASTGRFLGGMAAILQFSPVRSHLGRFAPADGETYVIDERGTVIVSSRRETAALTHAVPEAALEVLRTPGTRTADYVNYRGVEVVGTLAPVPGSDWYVVAELPRAVAFAAIAELRDTTLLTILVLLVIVGGLAYVLGTLIVRPLDRLTAAATEVAAGNYDVDLPVRGDDEIALFTRVFNDMVDRVRQSRLSLERLSVTDELTGLANRRFLMEVLDGEVRRGLRHEHPFALLMIDVDRFKEYNDTWGHLEGDTVLERMGTLLHEITRDVDHAARYGGEEFAVVLPETALEAAAEVAERIRHRVRDTPFGNQDAPDRRVTVSIGVSVFPAHGESPEALIAAADAALYQAKRAGRDRTVTAEQVPTAVLDEPAAAPAPARKRGQTKRKKRKKTADPDG